MSLTLPNGPDFAVPKTVSIKPKGSIEASGLRASSPEADLLRGRMRLLLLEKLRESLEEGTEIEEAIELSFPRGFAGGRIGGLLGAEGFGEPSGDSTSGSSSSIDSPRRLEGVNESMEGILFLTSEVVLPSKPRLLC